ncbi:MAG TPA: type II toxin-antitoxin system RelE/ParE family toxin [Candidatus Binataceae bacterium]|nr:type II toxin-antitoxin system RelE/ParE family toxin [Candidatus Binataceae bacterium]
MRITERAAREICDATAWWARERSTDEAERWYQGIRGAIAGLATLPRRCPLIADQEGLNYETREFHYGSGSTPTHRVIFAIVGEQVVVLAVRHFARRPFDSEDLPG